MDDRRGLVIERSRNRITAITKDGKFVTWKDRRDLVPGEEVVIPKPSLWGYVWVKAAFAAALAVIMVFVSSFGYKQYLYARPVMAYVTFDSAGETAGSIELAVNDRGLVKSAVGLDQAGTTALSKVECEMKPVEAVLSSISKVLPKSEEVVVAFIPVKSAAPLAVKPDSQKEGGGDSEEDAEDAEDKKKVEKRDDKADKRLAELEKQVLSIIKQATSITLDIETRNEAKSIGISAGRAASWALWKQQGASSPASPPASGGKPAASQDEPPAVPAAIPGKSAPDPAPPSKSPKEGPSSPVKPVKPEQEGKPEQQDKPKQPEQKGSGSGGPPSQHGKPSQPVPSPKKPVGESDIESLLDKIKGTLPQLKLDELDEDDAKEVGKRVGEVTKEWLKTFKEITKESSGPSGTAVPGGKTESKSSVTQEPKKPSGQSGKDKDTPSKKTSPKKTEKHDDDDEDDDDERKQVKGKPGVTKGKGKVRPTSYAPQLGPATEKLNLAAGSIRSLLKQDGRR